jgi:hypothetical protein
LNKEGTKVASKKKTSTGKRRDKNKSRFEGTILKKRNQEWPHTGRLFACNTTFFL